MLYIWSYIQLTLCNVSHPRRILTNLVIIAVAVGITYAIGVITRLVWGIAV